MTLYLAVRAEDVETFTADTGWLDEGDAVASHSWSITPAGPALANADALVVKVGPGFEAGKVYRLTYRATSLAGRSKGFSGDIALRCIA